MQVNGQIISEDDVVELLPQIYQLCIDHDIPATFFEITTALAFMYYTKEKTKVVVLETGLGGRLDATNVIGRPAVSVITSIGLEHTRILGDTIEKIALEKGGIIKPGRPVLVGPHCPHDVLRQCAKEKESGEYHIPQDVLKEFVPHLTDEDFVTDDYDIENQQTAEAALVLVKQSYPELLQDLSWDEMMTGTTIRPPCRFEEVKINDDDDDIVILDVAHNPPAMAKFHT